MNSPRPLAFLNIQAILYKIFFLKNPLSNDIKHVSLAELSTHIQGEVY